jgi:hypothetical protein
LVIALAASPGSHARSLAAGIPRIEATHMRKFISTMMAGVMMAGLGIGLAGCSDESSVKSETKATGPGGTTTVTDKTSVKTSGDNPPPVAPKPAP